MQRKKILENEIRKLLKEKPSDKRKSDAILILKKISQSTILTAREKMDLLRIGENTGESTSFFSSKDPKNNKYFFPLLLTNGKDANHESINLLIHLQKELGHEVFININTINTLITKNYIDLIYLCLTNQLIRPEEFSTISKVADPLVDYIFQMKHADKWQAFDYALCKHEDYHPLHLVLKGSKDSKALERIRKAVHYNDTPAPSYAPSPPSSRHSYFIQPRLYPSLDGAVEVPGYRKN